MGLQWVDDDVLEMNLWECVHAIIALRRDVRAKHDARDDDLCWLDDWPIYRHIPELRDRFDVFPTPDECRRQCKLFIAQRTIPVPKTKVEMRRDASPSPSQKLTEKRRILDAKLIRLPLVQLRHVLSYARNRVRNHHARGENKIIADEMNLFVSVLPEGTTPDFSSPRDQYENCERFIDSRPSPCPVEKMHQW